MDEGARVVKERMGRWEEWNNDNKEERLKFGMEEGEEIKILGSWMGAEADARNRIRRAGSLWAKVRGWLKGSRFSKKWQARIVEGCVESSLLSDCQVRVWQRSEIKRLQKWVDKCYRYVWSDRNGQPLLQMQERHLNMQDVRTSLNIRSIEKRVLERIGHILRMENDKLVKIAVLGWMKELEGLNKWPGKKSKTVLYWKRVLSNAGNDWTDIERICVQRSEWR